MEQGTYFIGELIAMCYVVSLTLMVWKLFGIVLQAETKSTNSYTYIYNVVLKARSCKGTTSFS